MLNTGEDEHDAIMHEVKQVDLTFWTSTDLQSMWNSSQRTKTDRERHVSHSVLIYDSALTTDRKAFLDFSSTKLLQASSFPLFKKTVQCYKKVIASNLAIFGM